MRWEDRIVAAVRKIDVPDLRIDFGGRYNSYLQFSTTVGNERADVIVPLTVDRREGITRATLAGWVDNAQRRLSYLRPQWRPELQQAATRLDELLSIARMELS